MLVFLLHCVGVLYCIATINKILVYYCSTRNATGLATIFCISSVEKPRHSGDVGPTVSPPHFSPSLLFAPLLQLPPCRNADPGWNSSYFSPLYPLLQCASSLLSREEFSIFFTRRPASNRSMAQMPSGLLIVMNSILRTVLQYYRRIPQTLTSQKSTPHRHCCRYSTRSIEYARRRQI